MLKFLLNTAINTVYAQPIEPPTESNVGDLDAIYALFKVALNWFFAFAIILAVIILIFSGIQWMSSGGNDEARKSALSRIMYTMAGVAIVFLAWIIVMQVIPSFLGIDVTGA
ncbi:MAG: hypothetical protein US76_04350 [Parcubacteria group bacterium GW2011_GWA2_38_13b]|nr:MAG: hypothetical protein US76_04350 [Parcubacteria group bacterium GW2011_GWA2_38_13b]